jgi:hypothetical protein
MIQDVGKHHPNSQYFKVGAPAVVFWREPAGVPKVGHRRHEEVGKVVALLKANDVGAVAEHLLQQPPLPQVEIHAQLG